MREYATLHIYTHGAREMTASIESEQEHAGQAVTFFEKQATGYVDNATRRPEFRERFRLFERQIELARRQLGASPRCVDLGCGPGTLTIKARQMGFNATGLDGSPSMLEHARSSAQRSGLDVDFRDTRLPLDGEQLARLEGSVDLLIASSVIEYMPDDLQFARQCYRLLAPGGVCLISFANSQSIYRAAERQLTETTILRDSYMTVQHRQYDRVGARQLFNQAGLRTESIHYFGLPRWLYPVWRVPERPPWLANLFLLVLRQGDAPLDGARALGSSS